MVRGFLYAAAISAALWTALAVVAVNVICRKDWPEL